MQKLENLYLAILRFVVILVAGLLLAAVITFGLASFRALQAAPEDKKATPVVNDTVLKKAILDKETLPSESETAAKPAQTKADPNQAFYDRAAATITNFVTNNAADQESVNVPQVASILKDRATRYEKQNLTGAFAKNFAESVEKLLADPAIAEFSKQSSPLQTVNRLLSIFIKQFDEQIEATNAENIRQQQVHLERKAEGQQNIYLAAGAFGAFLMIVFLSIIIRIERNLRHLEKTAA